MQGVDGNVISAKSLPSNIMVSLKCGGFVSNFCPYWRTPDGLTSKRMVMRTVRVLSLPSKIMVSLLMGVPCANNLCPYRAGPCWSVIIISAHSRWFAESDKGWWQCHLPATLSSADGCATNFWPYRGSSCNHFSTSIFLRKEAVATQSEEKLNT